MMLMHWNPPSLLRLLTQDVFGTTRTLCTDALAKITGQQQIDIHTATHLARGRPNRTTGAPSHTAVAHKDMERCSTCTAQRISADKASSLAQTSLHTDRTPSLGSPSIQEHAEAHPHTHTDSLEASEPPPSLHHTRRIQPLPLYQRAALSTLTEQPPSHHQPTHHPSEQTSQPPQVRSRWLWERP
jgi:hypothetical protein